MLRNGTHSAVIARNKSRSRSEKRLSINSASSEVRQKRGAEDGNSENSEAENDITSRVRMNNDVLETDGTTSNGHRDPPGQKSAYILSGDHRSEFYRLGTFGNFPPHCPVSPTDLASAGFYYTGFRDKVRCFSCGIVVENWTIGDIGCDPKWHKNDCALTHGGEHGNIPDHFSKRRNIFKQFFNINPRPPPSVATPCAPLHLTTLGGVTQIYAAADTISNALGNIHLNDSLIEPARVLKLAEIHSTQHEQMIRRLNLTRESDRRQTFVKWPSYPAPSLPGKLAQEGFFYLGNLDRTQCFSCSGVLRDWSSTDDARTEHGKHFPNCPIVLGTERRNIPMSVEERRITDEEEYRRVAAVRSTPPKEPDDPTPEEQSHLERFYPCLHPVNSSMETEEARLGTFAQSWPAHKMKATPRQIARAGFYYLGDGDRTKCFYCNGGLQNWEENDEPWTEHAKWFPGCEFVLRKKGAEFVRRLVQENPNLRRPAIRSPVSFDIPPPPAAEMRQNFSGPPIALPVASSSSDKDVVAKLELLRQEGLCRSCHRNNAEFLCLPCSHVALCSLCSTRSRKCPVCGGNVSSTLKVYRT